VTASAKSSGRLAWSSPFAALLMSFACLATTLVTAQTSLGEDPPAAKLSLAGGKLELSAPATWEVVPPKSSIVQYEFKAPKLAGEDAARITIMQASGGVEANIDRWIGQFDGATKNDAKIDKKQVAGTTIHVVDISGTYKDSMGGGPFAPGPVKKRENYRMMGAIIETKEAGTVFIKMTGDQAIVEQLADGFRKSLDDLKAK
jgi:hypothetical protein